MPGRIRFQCSPAFLAIRPLAARLPRRFDKGKIRDDGQKNLGIYNNTWISYACFSDLRNEKTGSFPADSLFFARFPNSYKRLNSVFTKSGFSVIIIEYSFRHPAFFLCPAPAGLFFRCIFLWQRACGALCCTEGFTDLKQYFHRRSMKRRSLCRSLVPGRIGGSACVNKKKQIHF